MKLRIIVVSLAMGAVAVLLALTGRSLLKDQHDSAASAVAASERPARRAGAAPPPGWAGAAVSERISRLEARLDEEVNRTAALRQQLDAMSAMLESLRSGAQNGEDPHSGAEAATFAAAAAPQPVIDGNKSAMQRALEAAGLDASTAEEIKRRGDQLAMTEVYLRDQATREGWLDSPRYSEEMAAIEAQRTSLRDELGDDTYDRYLFAQGRTNRVIVDDVMFQSVAEDVGLKSGDLIVRYDDTFLFSPDELVTQTHNGPIGETVTLEVVRAGVRFEVEVPRGPLGLRIGAAQDDPDAS